MQATSSLHVTTATPQRRYDGVAIAFHWLLALLLTTSFSVGLYMTELPMSPAKLKVYNWHKWAGVSILLLSSARLMWRLTHRPPPLPTDIAAGMPRWQHVAHRATHRLMYLLFFCVPLAGWAYSSASGFPVVWFGVLALPDFVPVDRALAETLHAVHVLAAFALAALAALHVAAALLHQFVRRDGLLARMWPTRAGLADRHSA